MVLRSAATARDLRREHPATARWRYIHARPRPIARVARRPAKMGCSLGPSPSCGADGEMKPARQIRWIRMVSGFRFDPKNEDPCRLDGLSKRTTSEGLREAFAKFGQLVQARVVTDRASGYSKGFGFVRYATLEDAEAGIKGMDGKFLDGWVIFAEYAKPRPPPAAREDPQPPPSYQSQTYNTYSSSVPGNTQPQPAYSTHNMTSGIPQSPPYSGYNGAATENSPPSSYQYNGFNNAGAGNTESPPSYQYSSSSNVAPGHLQSPPSHQHGDYGSAVPPVNPQSSPYEYNNYNGAAPTWNPQSAASYQYNNYNSAAPQHAQSQPAYQNNASIDPMHHPQSAANYQHGNWNYPNAESSNPPSESTSQYGGCSSSEAPQSEPAYQYGG